MGGGGFTMEPDNPALDDLIIELAGVREPKVLFLPTASGDPAEHIAQFQATFGDRECQASHLSLFRRHGSARSLREIVMGQDVVYVGGGSMRNMLAVWRVHGLDELLLEAYRGGIVLAGLSAGAMCWFEAGVTMSGGPPEPIRGLGFLPGSLSVHADGEPERLPVFLEAVRSGVLPGGWACDDGVGLVVRDGVVERVVTSRPGATALKVDAVLGELVRRRVTAELLGGAAGEPRPDSTDVRELRRLRYGNQGGR